MALSRLKLSTWNPGLQWEYWTNLVDKDAFATVLAVDKAGGKPRVRLRVRPRVRSKGQQASADAFFAALPVGCLEKMSFQILLWIAWMRIPSANRMQLLKRPKVSRLPKPKLWSPSCLHGLQESRVGAARPRGLGWTIGNLACNNQNISMEAC